MRNFSVIYQGEPHRNRTLKVRGVCTVDVLNPCWDNRKDDVPGQHWAGGSACDACTKAANKAREKR